MLEMLLPPRGRAHKLREFVVDYPLWETSSELNLGVEIDSGSVIGDFSKEIHISNLSTNSIGVNVSRFLFDDAGNADNNDLFCFNLSDDGLEPFPVMNWIGE